MSEITDSQILDWLEESMKDHVWVRNKRKPNGTLSDRPLLFNPLPKGYCDKFEVPYYLTFRDAIRSELCLKN